MWISDSCYASAIVYLMETILHDNRLMINDEISMVDQQALLYYFHKYMCKQNHDQVSLVVERVPRFSWRTLFFSLVTSE